MLSKGGEDKNGRDMGRITDLKYQNDQIKRTNKEGPFVRRTARHQTVNRFINALGATRSVPAKWYAITKEDVIGVIGYWKKQNKKDSTIRKYISQIKSFFNAIGHQVDGLDYKSLGIDGSSNKINYSINDEVIEKIYDPLVKNILLLQTKFGLTLSEAVLFAPDIHTYDEGLWLTREITRNSLDRTIKYQNEHQKKIINELSSLLDNCESAKSRFGYEDIRALYRIGLRQVGLKSSINYRTIYARERFQSLTKQTQKKIARQKIREEMGISPATLRRFLNEPE